MSRPGRENAGMEADDLLEDRPAVHHTRPPGVDDATVEALGKLSEALETIEDARGSLYRFHRLTGKADLAIGEAAELFRAAGALGRARGPVCSRAAGAARPAISMSTRITSSALRSP